MQAAIQSLQHRVQYHPQLPFKYEKYDKLHDRGEVGHSYE